MCCEMNEKERRKVGSEERLRYWMIVSRHVYEKGGRGGEVEGARGSEESQVKRQENKMRMAKKRHQVPSVPLMLVRQAGLPIYGVWVYQNYMEIQCSL